MDKNVYSFIKKAIPSLFFFSFPLKALLFLQVGRNENLTTFWATALEEENLDCDVIAVHSAFFGRMRQAPSDFHLVISLISGSEEKITVCFYRPSLLQLLV